MQVRPWTVADVPRILELIVQLGYRVTAAELRTRLERLGDHAVAFVCDDGVVEGFVAARLDDHPTEGPAVEVTALVVAEGRRREGFARLLMGAVEEWAAGRSRERVRLRSNVRRQDAHAFYESLGYEVVKRSSVFEKRLRA